MGKTYNAKIPNTKIDFKNLLSIIKN